MIMIIEGCSPGTTFELEVIRRFEGIPSDESMTQEREQAELGH